MAPSIRNRGVTPKSAWTMLCEEQEQQSSSSIRLPLHLADHPSFPLHLGVNAVAGPAGSGKTQLCLSLVANCVWHNKKAVIISLGKDTTVLVSQRLHSILKHRKLKMMESSKTTTTTQPQSSNNNSNNNSSNIDESIKQEYLSKIFVNWVRNQDDMLHMLHYGLPKLLKEHPSISLVVLDGIATLFRGKEVGGTTWVERSAKFFQIASQSQKLSFGYQVPFLFTNEATSKLSSNNGGFLANTSRLEPALGLSWAQCINSSFFVQRHSQSSNRVLKCIKSPHMASNRTADFAIEPRGIVRIKEK